MKTHTLLSATLAAALLPLSAGAAKANPLVLKNVSAREAAARMGARYGMDIVLQANAGRHVNVFIEDEDGAEDAGARLQTVNALANALKLDYTKTIIVNRSALDEALEGGTGTAAGASAAFSPAEAVDSTVTIPFGKTRLRTREAITLIAGVDDAFAHIAGDVGGFVTLSKPTLPIAQAAEEIAKQTGTTWKAVYTLAPYSRVASAASPLIFFPDRQWEAQQRRQEEEAERQAAQQQAAYQAYQQAAAQQQGAARPTIVGALGMNGQAANGNGYYPNGYGNGGYPSDASGFGMTTSGNAGGSFPNHVVGGNQ